MKPQIVIVLVNRNSAADTIECVQSLQNCTYPWTEIVIVDNGSDDDSEEVLRKALNDSRIIIFQTGKNKGFSGANNVGIRYALERNSEYVLLINNDTLVEPDFIEPMVEAMENDNQVGAAGGTICYFPETDRIWYAGGTFLPWKALSVADHFRESYSSLTISGVREVSFMTGCLTLVRAEVLRKVGFLDERFFIYFEDAEFSQRLIHAGYKLIYVPQTRIYHKFWHRGQKPFSLYYTVRNQLLFARTATKGMQRMSAISYHLIMTMVKMLVWFFYKPDMFKAARRGIIDYKRGTFFEGRGLSFDYSPGKREI